MKFINKLKKVILISVFTVVYNMLYSQVTKQITISVQGIEYENPGFINLRENLKKNTKVKSIKPSFSEGVAMLTINYPDDASQLWDEVAKPVKLPFKLEAIDDESISLTYATGQNKKTAPSLPVKANNKITKKGDCFDCDYFPFCVFDETKSYGGKIYHGIRGDDEAITYYNCDNGVVTTKWESVTAVVKGDAFNGFYDDEETKLHTMTVLKSNVSAGTEWVQKDDGYDNTFKMLEKGLKLTHDGKVYNDVIKIRLIKLLSKEMNDKVTFLGNLVQPKEEAFYFYYGKNIGLIKYEDVYKELVEAGTIKPRIISESNPLMDMLTKGEHGMREEAQKKQKEEEQKIEETENQKRKKEVFEVSKKAHLLMKGSVDNSLAGLWKKQGKGGTGRTNYQYIRFNNDGTVDFYETILEDKFTGYLQNKFDYRIEGPSFYKVPNYDWTIKKYPTCYPGYFELSIMKFSKSTDTQTGKIALYINDEKCTFIEANK